MSIVGRSFLHASDLHLGTPLGGLLDCKTLEAEDLENLVKEMWAPFNNLIEIAIDRRVLFVVLAGDIYDSLEQQDGLQAKFRAGLQRLKEENIHVYMIHGNHDPKIAKNIYRRALPDNVHVFESDKPHEFLAAESNEGNVYVAGISFAKQEVPENLATQFNDLPSEHARWRVGVLHTSMAGNNDHDPYAPCSAEDLRRAPVGYWALGHIHLRSDSNSLGMDRWWAYPGNLQGRSFKPSECHPKGVLLVTLNRNGFDQPEFVECDTVRFVNVVVPIDDVEELRDCYQLIYDAVQVEIEKNSGHQIVARVKLSGKISFSKELRNSCDSGDLLKKFCDDYEAELQETIVSGITSEARPKFNFEELRFGDSLLATTLRRLDEMSDEEVVDQAKSLIKVDAIVYVAETAGLIRQRAERALVEAILENEIK